MVETASNVTHASLWTGTAGSWIDLHPSVADRSYALDAQAGEQVGWAQLSQYHASLWRGTASSWVDLHPSAATSSMTNAVFAGRQVGYAEFGGQPHACTWTGTSDSWVDLHAFLPPQFQSSSARDVWSDAASIYVVGDAFNATAGRTEAVMWIRPLPCQLDAPNIEAASQSQAFMSGQTITLFVQATAAGPLTYQWHKDGIAIQDGGRVAGSNKAVLRVSDASGDDAGNYACKVATECSYVLTPDISISIFCPADTNRDTFLDFTDFDAFVSAFEAGC